MTSSSIRPIFHRDRASARRTRLLAASALISSFVGGVAAMLAQPALAQTLPAIPGAGSITVSTGGSMPTITAPNGNTLDIDLNAPRTVINWASLHVSGADRMDFHFDASSDIVLNKTTSQILIDAGGAVTGKVGASDGGNIWFYSPQGMIVSPGAVMTGGGFLFSRGSGIVDAGFVDAGNPLNFLRAAADSLIKIDDDSILIATTASIGASGDVVLSRASGNINAALAIGAGSVTVTATTGNVTLSETRANGGAATVTAGGAGATVSTISAFTDVSVSSNGNTSVGSAVTTLGDVTIQGGTVAALTSANSGRDVSLSATQVFTSTIDTVRDAFVTATTGGATVTNRIFAGDDVEITATTGDVTAAGATLRSSGLGGDDGHVLVRSTGGAVTVNAAQTFGTGVSAGDIIISAATAADLTALSLSSTSSGDLTVSGASASLTNGSAAGDILVSATTGNATVVTQAIAGDDVDVASNSGNVLAGGALLRSTGIGAPDSANVLARSLSGSVTVGTAQTQGAGAAVGNVNILAATVATLGAGNSTGFLNVSGASASLTTGVAALDLQVTATTGDATVVTSAIAVDDVEITTIDGDVVAGGATLRSTGIGVTNDAHVLARSVNGSVTVGTAQTQGTGAALGSVNILAATAATLDSGDATAILNVTGASASLTTGVAGRDLQVTATTGDATVVISATAADDIEITTTDGDVLAGGATLTSTGLSTGVGDGHVWLTSTNGAVDFGTAITQGTGISAGDVTVLAGDTATGISAQATRDVSVTAPFGITLGSATAARDITLFATVGDVALGGAELTGSGAGHDLSVRGDGVVTFGAVDEPSITAANAFTRAGGNTGTAVVQSLTDDTWVYLDTSAAIDTLSGGNVTAVVNSGPATFGTITAQGNLSILVNDGDLALGAATANTGDLQVDVYSGDMTVGTANAPGGGLGLYANDGLLTITGSAHGGGAAQIESLGLLDGTSASLISSGGALDLAGGQVDVGLLQAASILVIADDGNVSIQSAQGMLGFAVTANGDIFVDTAQSPDVVVQAGGDIVLNSPTATGVGGLVLVAAGGDVTIDSAEANGVGGGVLVQAFGDVLIRSAKANGADGGVYVGSFGDAMVELAEAKGANGNIHVEAMGNATLRAAEAPLGILVYAMDTGKATLGADDAGSITNVNTAMTAGASGWCGCSPVADGLQVFSEFGDAVINAYALTGPVTLISAEFGAATVTVQTGALTVDRLTAQGASQVNGGGDTRLVSAAVASDLAVRSLTGNVRFGDGPPGQVIDVGGTLSLNAFTDIAQQGALHADRLDVTSRTGVVLLGDNQIAHLGQVNVAAGGFAFHSMLDFDVAGVVSATGQTVDLRSDGTINQASNAVITAQTLTGSSVGGAVFDAANQVAELGDFTNTGGQLRLTNGRSLTVTGAVLSTGVLSLVSHGGMTIAGTGTVRANGAGDAVVLASDGVFTNARGADAVTAASPAGRWLVYTQAFGDPQGSTAGNTFNGLVGKSFYGSAYDFSTSSFAVGVNSGNRFVYAYQPVLTVTPNSQTLIYDGTIPTTSATIAGLVNGDLAADAWSGAPTISGATSKAAGTYVLTAGPGGLASDLNYAFSYGTGSLRIDPKALTGVLIADNKTYDGTTAAGGSIGLTGLVAGDTVLASGSYAFVDSNAAAGKTVTATGSVLAGPDAGNYSLTSVSGALADILRRHVTVAADSGFKPFGQAEPTLTYRITIGDLVASDAFTGALEREAGETPGSYGIMRGTLALSANYDLTFTGAVFTIRPFSSNEAGGAPTFKYLDERPDFTLDWDPALNLTTAGSACLGEGCPPQAAAPSSKAVAALH